MQENLSDLVKTGVSEDPVTFEEESLTIPEETPTTQQNEETTYATIPISSLNDWIDSNVSNFPNIKKPNVAVQDVDLTEQLLLTVLVTSEGGQEKRKFVLYDDSHLQPVLNLSAVDMQIYNNGFRIIYDFGDGIFIKSYGIRTGLISVFCNDIDNKLIPYAVVRTKKRDSHVEVLANDIEEVKQKLLQQLDFEALQLRYKQSSKTEGFNTNGEAIDWLLERQATIGDIHHHLQIDNVIIDTLG